MRQEKLRSNRLLEQFHRMPVNKRDAVTPRARAIFTILSKLTFRSPRSIPPMYVQCRSAFSASPSWESPRARRRLLTV